MKLSVVTTLYRSAGFLEEFVDRALQAASRITDDFELILVDDGSPDDSLKLALQRRSRDPRICVVELSRNFGHHAAILAGLAVSKGDLVFFVDSDLEEPPELLLEFHGVMNETGADVVYGKHGQTTGSLARRVTSNLFWRAFNLLSDIKIERNICHVRLMKRRYLNELLRLDERNIFLGGLYSWPGYRQVGVWVDRRLRREVSTYTAFRRLALSAQSIISFSTRPLYFVFFIGLAISVLSMGAIVYLTVEKIINPDAILSGFTALMVSIWFFGGLNIAFFGIVGLYVGQIYTEVKRRPRYVIRAVHAAFDREPTAGSECPTPIVSTETSPDTIPTSSGSTEPAREG